MFLLYSLSLGGPIWPILVGGPRVRPVRAHSSYATADEVEKRRARKTEELVRMFFLKRSNQRTTPATQSSLTALTAQRNPQKGY